jgi:4-amino-4-deoxy-L-arabinose transferase-like glycosyltransferase
MVLKEALGAEVSPILGNGSVALVEKSDVPPRSRRIVMAAECIGLVLTVALAGGLRLWNLQQNGWGTTYYSAAVRSGMESWHNFFYNSLDPGGFVCVDKPPVAIWVQVVSTKIFGFSQMSVLVPQAVMGILSVLILWHLVRRRFGALAGFLAALALAITPISVAIERSNNTDACLAFVLLLSGWALIRAAEKGSLWLLLLSMFLVGVAFNTKMLVAFVVLPTFYLVYLLGAPVSWRSRLGDLALATFVVFAVALSWAIAYDLTPEDNRPYADSTQNNSMLTLIVEHNAMDRFIRRGRGRPAPGMRPAAGAAQPLARTDGRNAPDQGAALANATAQAQAGDGQNRDGQPAGGARQRRARGAADGMAQGVVPGQGQADGPVAGGFAAGGLGFGPGAPFGPGGGPGGPGGRGGLGWGGGSPVGPWRLFHPHMAGQVLWLFPLAIVGLVVAAFQARWSWTLAPQHQAMLLWLGWLGTYCVVYSFAGGIFHDYYLVTMSAPMAALTGIGGAALWKAFQHGKPSFRAQADGQERAGGICGWRLLFLPLAVLLTAGWQVLVWLNYPELAKWAVPALVIATMATGLALLALRGSWWAPVLAISVLACAGWLWSRDSAAPDILSLAATELDHARTSLRELEGWDSFKRIYTKVSPDISSLLPDLRRQAPLATPPLLLGCGIACGCLLVLFILAKWRPILAKGTGVALAVCFLALFLSPAVWSLTPVWRSGGMLPAADANVFVREMREREQRAREAARGAALTLSASNWADSPSLLGTNMVLAASDLALFTRGQRGGRGLPGGLGGPGFAGGVGGPGMPPRNNERARQDRQKMVAFLKANHNGERWLLAVSGSQQASSYIIEDGLSVMPMGGFGGGAATFGTEPEEIKARVAKLVDEGQIRFFQLGGGRGGLADPVAVVACEVRRQRGPARLRKARWTVTCRLPSKWQAAAPAAPWAGSDAATRLSASGSRSRWKKARPRRSTAKCTRRKLPAMPTQENPGLDARSA